MKSNRTKGKILDTSIKLFNEKKASNVSTVQISAAMEISPGNLYYYYANKEEVIRCIWQERMIAEIDDLIAKCGDVATAEDLLELFRGIVAHCVRYRFFYTEMPTLFANDGTIMDIYIDVNERSVKAAAALYRSFMESGGMIRLSDDELDLTAKNGVLMILAIINSCDVRSCYGFDEKIVTEAVWSGMAAYLKPYLTDDMRSGMDRALESLKL